LKRFLSQIDKPLRYIDHEVNAVHKDFDTAKVRFCFIYPDVYEIGISHLGIKILYSIINKHEQYMADRAYTPWPDLADKLLAHKIPLSSIEAGKPLQTFDCLGFTLQTELTYTNILYTLDLAQIPLCAGDRKESDPIIIAGGINAVNPHTLSRFIDAFFIGEAEEGIVCIAEIFENVRDRAGRLRALAELPFMYVPVYSGSRTIYAQKYYGFPESEDTHFPQIVPMLEGTHNRYTAEIMRGCYRGCRFCQAGMFYRPVREKDPNIIIKQLLEDVQRSGWEEAGLLSLSSTDYSCIKPLLTYLTQALKGSSTSLAFPSLRVDTLDESMASLIQELQKSGVTLAPEAGTQRLRDIINKNLSEEEILDAVQTAYTAGAKLIKLYFMVGLPFETADDVQGIITLIEKIVTLTRKKMRINISISPFVPKPMTPFMWHGMESEAVILDKVLSIKHALFKYKHIKLNYHTIESSYLEVVLGRGDSDVGLLIETAYRHGAKFDGWREYFSYQIWQEAAAEIGYDWYKAIRGYGLDAILPWDNINIGVDKDFLLNEYEKASCVATTPDCRESCAGCGVNCREGIYAVRQFAISDSINGVPTSGVTDTINGVPTSGVTDTINGVPTSGVTDTINGVPTTLVADGINAVPTSGVADGINGVPTSGVTDAINGIPTIAVTDGINGVPTSGVTDTINGVPTIAVTDAINGVPTMSYRVFFSKVNDLKYLSHLDFLRLIHRLLKLSGLPVAYSQGFNQHPRTSFCPPLSSGIEGLNEFFDVVMTRQCEPQVILDSLSKTQIRDLRFFSAVPHDRSVLPIKHYDTEVVSVVFDGSVDIQLALEAFYASGDTVLLKEKKDGVRAVDLANVILGMVVNGNTLSITKKIAGASVFDILYKIFSISRENANALKIVRMEVIVGAVVNHP